MNKPAVIEHNGERILTTSQLAEAYGTDTQVVVNNFNRNKNRYKEGKHFISLEDAEKRTFVNQNQIDLGSKNAKILYLWTEKGAWLHAKSLNTDQAWNAYEMLVDEYYRTKEQPQYQVTVDRSKESEAKKLAAEARLKNAEARLASEERKRIELQMKIASTFKDSLSPEMNQLLASHLVNTTIGIPLLPQPETEKLYTCEEIAKELGVYSTKGKPHRQIISAVVNELKSSGEIAEVDYLVVLESKGNWTGDTTKYKRSVVGKVKAFLEELDLVSPVVELNNKRFNINPDFLNINTQ